MELNPTKETTVPGKKRRLGVVVLCVLVVGVGALTLWPGPKEPEYQGKKLSEWLERYPASQEQGREAVCAIGADGIPWLVRWLSTDDRRNFVRRIQLRRKLPPWIRNSSVVARWLGPGQYARRCEMAVLGFEILGTNGASAVPELTQLFERSSDYAWVASALAFVGKEGLPPLIKVASDRGQSGARRISAIGGLQFMAYLGSDACQAVPVLIGCLSDTNVVVCDMARRALEKFAADPASNAGLVYAQQWRGFTTTRDPELRSCVVLALKDFGTNAAHAEWATKVVREALEDSDAKVRAEATNAMARIERHF